MLQHNTRPRLGEADFPESQLPDAPRVTPRYSDAVGLSPADYRDAELRQVLEPMLEAVVRLAGATAATLRRVGADGASGAPVAAVGHRKSPPTAPWCAVCDEAVDPESECVLRHVCGSAEQLVASTVTQVCRHITVLPLEHRGHPVGTLSLLFAGPCDLPPETIPVLKSVGDLLGVTLENTRLARENLRMTLTNERQMMANEVHDSLAQALTYMRMRMSLLSDAIRQRDELHAFKYWADVDDSLTNAHGRLRDLITYFRSRMDPQGLVHALSETAEGFFDRTGVVLAFENRVSDFCLPADRELEIFHIVQEALANVLRHARAQRVDLILSRGRTGYEITVVDDGVGLGAYPEAGERDDPGHYGIAIMRERAQRLGGSLTLEKAPEAGTCVRLWFPAVHAPSENRS